MTTAEEMLKRSSRLAGVRSNTKALSGDQSTTYLGLLNDYLEFLKVETNGAFSLGALSVGDTIYLSAGDLLAIRYGLARLIADDSGFPLQTSVYQNAEDFERTLIERYLDNEQADIDRALHPRGHYLYDITRD